MSSSAASEIRTQPRDDDDVDSSTLHHHKSPQSPIFTSAMSDLIDVIAQPTSVDSLLARSIIITKTQSMNLHFRCSSSSYCLAFAGCRNELYCSCFSLFCQLELTRFLSKISFPSVHSSFVQCNEQKKTPSIKYPNKINFLFLIPLILSFISPLLLVLDAAA